MVWGGEQMVQAQEQAPKAAVSKTAGNAADPPGEGAVNCISIRGMRQDDVLPSLAIRARGARPDRRARSRRFPATGRAPPLAVSQSVDAHGLGHVEDLGLGFFGATVHQFGGKPFQVAPVQAGVS